MAKPKHVYLIAAARKVWYWSPARKAAVKAAMVGPDLIRCAQCQQLMSAKLKVKKRHVFCVDHIDPIVPVDKLSPTLEETPGPSNSLGWEEYLRRLMYGALQVLCLPCHAVKTKKETRERKQNRQGVSPLRPRRKG